MSLYVIATPISTEKDLGLRAISILQNCRIIIAEDRKNILRLLSNFGFKNVEENKQIYLLNEHNVSLNKNSKNFQKQNNNFLGQLVDLCKIHECALVSDCGTPNFCDPGAELVYECRIKEVKVISVPGPSSLTSFISICGIKLERFLFLGFLPQKENLRNKELNKINLILNSKIDHYPIILMDTPYRLINLLTLCKNTPHQTLITLALNLGSSDEIFFQVYSNEIESKILSFLNINERFKKSPFILMLSKLIQI